MEFVGGRQLFKWLSILRGNKQSGEETLINSDTAKNGLSSLQRKLELVVLAKTIDGLHYWEFPPSLSQSRLNGRQTLSNACALIATNIASAFYSDERLSASLALDNRREDLTDSEGLAMNTYKVCPPEFIRVMKEAIMKGNKMYDEEKKRGKQSAICDGPLLSLPNAIAVFNRCAEEEASGSSMREVDFVSVEGRIGELLPQGVLHAIDHPILAKWKIFCFALVADSKFVSLIYRRDLEMFVLMDSHAHNSFSTGAMVAVSSRVNLGKLCEWMEVHFFPDLPKQFELSLLQCATSSLNPNEAVTVKILHTPHPSSLTSNLFRFCLLTLIVSIVILLVPILFEI